MFRPLGLGRRLQDEDASLMQAQRAQVDPVQHVYQAHAVDPSEAHPVHPSEQGDQGVLRQESHSLWTAFGAPVLSQKFSFCPDEGLRTALLVLPQTQTHLGGLCLTLVRSAVAAPATLPSDHQARPSGHLCQRVVVAAHVRHERHRDLDCAVRMEFR